MGEDETRERRSMTRAERQQAFENTTKLARDTIDEERRRRAEKTERLRQARLAVRSKDTQP